MASPPEPHDGAALGVVRVDPAGAELLPHLGRRRVRARPVAVLGILAWPLNARDAFPRPREDQAPGRVPLEVAPAAVRAGDQSGMGARLAGARGITRPAT